MACMIERLPKDFYQDLQDLWIQLLANVAQAGKRQLCKGMDGLPGRRLWHVPMIHKLAAMKCTSSRHKEVTTRLRQTLKKHGPAAVAALNAVVSNDPTVKKKQTELLTHWRTYARVLGINDLASVHLTEEPSSACPWETCNWKACLCHEKAANHKLHVCKGYWQAHYCSKKCQTGDWQDGHATICRQRTTARVNQRSE
ncbi:hypothetical protein EIP86_011580 [Pleurotus ostreatoroseus]|nr:hypothetical protein EIP86_011580 [Pleurotus ostreatoroseus]